MNTEKYQNIYPDVRAAFMADVPDNEIAKFQDKLKLFWMKTVDFFESNKLAYSKENLLKNANQIKNWEIGSKDENGAEIEVTTEKQENKKPCECSKIASIQKELKCIKKWSIIGFVLLVIIIWATKSNNQ